MKQLVVLVMMAALVSGIWFLWLRQGQDSQPALPYPQTPNVQVAQQSNAGNRAGVTPPPGLPDQTGVTGSISNKPPQTSIPASAKGPAFTVASRRGARSLIQQRQGEDRFGGAEVLESRESAPDAEGRITHTRLLRANFKYPLIRMEETVARDARTGEETVIKQSAMVGDHIMLKAKPETTTAQIEELARKHGGQVLRKMSAPDLYLIEFPGDGIDAVPQAVQSLTAETNAVAYAEPDFIIHALDTLPTDALFTGQWALQNAGQNGGMVGADIHAPEAWDISRGSTNVLVAVLDTGIDYNHPDLAANIWISPGEAGILSTNMLDDDGNGKTNDFRGWNFVSENNNPLDDNGHGTHCAGIIGAVGDNGLGVAGVCWNVSLVGLKILNSSGAGVTSDAMDAILYAINLRASVMSLSWGGSSFQQSLQNAIQQAATNNILVVAAAGNDGRNNDRTPVYPASYTNANIISVASSTRSDELSDFSNYGTNSVDIAVPGSEILSTWPGRKYKILSGTSMACPCVAGAAALLWSCEPWLTATGIKQAMLSTVDKVATLTGKTASGGRLNLARLLNNSPGLHFDRQSYFANLWAAVTLVNTDLSGTGNQTITLSSTFADTETLTLYEIPPASGIFTNRIWIAESVAASPGNGQLEGIQGTVFTAVYTNPGSSIACTASCEMNHGLRIVITSPEAVLPFETNQIRITGVNNGNVLVNMVVSNALTGDAKSFSVVNAWTAPDLALAAGPNLISVWGTNVYGSVGSDTVTVTRRGPPGLTNYVSLDGSHQWPFVTWATAATNIQDAVNAASTGNTILISNGVFRLLEQIEINLGVTVQGVNGASNTVIIADGFSRCFHLNHTNAILNGVAARGGNEVYGGGIFCDGGGMVRDCLVSSNSASAGGGIACIGAVEVVRCVAITNLASVYGGGLYCVGNGIVTDCEVVSNQSDYDAGGIFVNGSVLITNCTVCRNKTYDLGGGLRCESGFRIVNCVQ